MAWNWQPRRVDGPFSGTFDRFLTDVAAFFPYTFLPIDFRVQPVAAAEVASALCDCVASGPSGRLPDMGGPEVRRAGDLVHPWPQARGLRRLILPLPLPGATAAAFRRGANTCSDRRQGRTSWEAWLAQRYLSRTKIF